MSWESGFKAFDKCNAEVDRDAKELAKNQVEREFKKMSDEAARHRVERNPKYNPAIEPTVGADFVFTMKNPGEGPIEVRAPGDDIDDVVDAFRGFLIACGFASSSITHAMGKEW